MQAKLEWLNKIGNIIYRIYRKFNDEVFDFLLNLVKIGKWKLFGSIIVIEIGSSVDFFCWVMPFLSITYLHFFLSETVEAKVQNMMTQRKIRVSENAWKWDKWQTLIIIRVRHWNIKAVTHTISLKSISCISNPEEINTKSCKICVFTHSEMEFFLWKRE